MPRPKLGDSESKRLQMVITEAELEAIDEWQHEHRVASKSEAIRRLVQIGIRLERNVPLLLSHERKVLASIEAGLELVKSRLKNYRASQIQDTDTSPAEILIEFWRHVSGKILMTQLESFDHVHELASEVSPLVNAEEFGNLDVAIQRSNAARAKVAAGDTILRNALAERKAKGAEKKDKP